jgi:threonine/homoserine/homoserine lactone efflux protein
MQSVAFVLFVIAAVTTLCVLFAGLFVMARGGEVNRKYGNKLMRWRIMAQAVALIFFAIAMLIKDG